MAVKGGTGNLADIAVAMDRGLRVFSDFVRPILASHAADKVSTSNLIFLLSIKDGEARVNDIVKRGRYVGSNASYALKFLQDEGYIDRRQDPDDRRNAVVSWTPKGRALADALRVACGDGGSLPGEAAAIIRSFENHCFRAPSV
ncbi:winged helix DNA-binding protein [Agrobacterium rubi]|nr:winged helix DNA-binding protein [Agrobacterium rubi]NTF24338.1 winged helix DNA-binding protein [Agrobacterium rubi]